MKDLKHLIWFEDLLQQANNELVQRAAAEGQLALGYNCYYIPEVLLNLPGCFSSRLRAPNSGTAEIASYYMTNRNCPYVRCILERAIEGGFNYLNALFGAEGCAAMERMEEHFALLKPVKNDRFITTIIDRGYVERDQKKLKPTLLGRAVDGLMLEQFPHIVDVDFSAQMEKNLDKIESGKADWHKTVDDFYQGFEASLEQAEKNMEGKKVKVPDEPSSEVCDLCGRPMVIKVGKYGKFLACSGFPECRGTKRLVKDTGGICPKCGKGRMLERKSAKGRIYYGCERYPDCDFMTWDMPVATKCEKCGSTLFRKGSKLYCAKEGCDFEMPVPKKD